MSEQTQSGCPSLDEIREAVCIHASKVTDSFRDKDCIEDLRVYLTRESQEALDRAAGARARYAELLHVALDVSPVHFHRGYYSVDLTYYYRVLADALMGNARPVPIFGLAVFSKRVVLFGGEEGAKVFTSSCEPGQIDSGSRNNQTSPMAVLEAVDPMILAAKVADACSCCRCDAGIADLPESIFGCFDGELVLNGDGKRLYITLGQFSIIRMQRMTQLLLPAFDYSVPTKEFCDNLTTSEDSDPCEVFNQVEFPVDSFFPPRAPSDK